MDYGDIFRSALSRIDSEELLKLALRVLFLRILQSPDRHRVPVEYESREVCTNLLWLDSKVLL